jgi:hypothetical protein
MGFVGNLEFEGDRPHNYRLGSEIPALRKLSILFEWKSFEVIHVSRRFDSLSGNHNTSCCTLLDGELDGNRKFVQRDVFQRDVCWP